MKVLFIGGGIVALVLAVVAIAILILLFTKLPHAIAVRRAKIVGIAFGLCGTGWWLHSHGLRLIRNFL